MGRGPVDVGLGLETGGFFAGTLRHLHTYGHVKGSGGSLGFWIHILVQITSMSNLCFLRNLSVCSLITSTSSLVGGSSGVGQDGVGLCAEDLLKLEWLACTLRRV